jgi:hypothetical protein
MSGSDLLDTVDLGAGTTGLRGFMYDLQRASIEHGRQIRAWMIESNRAELMSSRAFRMFRDQFPDVEIVTSSTLKQSNDTMVGADALVPVRFRAGDIRLPQKASRPATSPWGKQTRSPHDAGSAPDL